MMKLYRVNEHRTLRGAPAGDYFDDYVEHYLAFRPGDYVAMIKKRPEGVIVAMRLDDGLCQELDLSSLTEIGEGLKLTAPEFDREYESWW